MDHLIALSDTLLSRLAWTAAQAVVLIAAVWLVTRSLPRLSPSIRCMLWWLVAVQLVLGMAINTPVQLRWLKATSPLPVGAQHTYVYTADNAADPFALPAQPAIARVPHATGFAWSWSEVIVALWLLFVLLQIVLAARQWRQSRALLREAHETDNASLHALCAKQAEALGIRRVPALRISDVTLSPQVTGLWRPVVLLPSEEILSSDELSMAIAHELAHIRRGDLWLGWLPAIAQRLFFFHPLVNWAMREYAVYREAACDAHVMQQHVGTPQHYGHLLLRLGVVDPMHASLAGASSTFLHLKRRLLMLQQGVGETTPRLRNGLLVAAIAVLGVLPYRVTATNATPDITQNASIPAVPPIPPAPAAPPAPAVPPAPPAPPAPPTPPTPTLMLGNARHVDIDTYANAARGIAFFDGDTVMFNGSESDLAEVQRLHGANDPMLWFRRNGRAYTIHDTTLVQRAREAFLPLNELARQQGELAGKQGALAGQQSGLAARQAALAGREAALASRRAALADQRAVTQNITLQDSVGQGAIREGQLAGMAAEQAEIQREYKAIHRLSEGLSKQAAVLSQQQATVATQRKRVAQHVDRQLDTLLQEALARGLAQPASR